MNSKQDNIGPTAYRIKIEISPNFVLGGLTGGVGLGWLSVAPAVTMPDNDWQAGRPNKNGSTFFGDIIDYCC